MVAPARYTTTGPTIQARPGLHRTLMKTVLWLLALLGFVQAVAAERLVTGQVCLSDGQPVAGAQVALFDLTDLRAGAVARATTDAAGAFALSGRGGRTLPDGFALGPNYPNPFNPSTIIPYQLPVATHVRLEVFNVLGQRVTTLVDGERPGGFHTAVWDATNAAGQAVGAGVYFYRLSSRDALLTGKMVLIDGQAGRSAVPGGFGEADGGAAFGGRCAGLWVDRVGARVGGVCGPVLSG